MRHHLKGKNLARPGFCSREPTDRLAAAEAAGEEREVDEPGLVAARLRAQVQGEGDLGHRAGGGRRSRPGDEARADLHGPPGPGDDELEDPPTPLVARIAGRSPASCAARKGRTTIAGTLNSLQ